jgi:hypothetical protein
VQQLRANSTGVEFVNLEQGNASQAPDGMAHDFVLQLGRESCDAKCQAIPIGGNVSTCSNCGTTILFGGVHEGQLHFCGQKCRDQQAPLIRAIRNIPDDMVADLATEVHRGTCPSCGGPGPVDMYTAHRIWSAIAMTSWNSKPQVCCRGCGTKAKLIAIAFSGAFGWWGFPWGLVFTPVQLFRNFAGLISTPDPLRPSAELLTYVRTTLALQSLQSDAVVSAEAVDEP